MILDQIWLYQDVGYSLGSHHVCYWAKDTSAITQAYTFTDVKTSKNTMFNLDLPMEYQDGIRLTYIKILKDQDVYYGWIVQVSEIAGRDNVCRIAWEFDYWRTYGGVCTYGAGRLIRAPTDLIGNPANQAKGFCRQISDQILLTDIISIPWSYSGGWKNARYRAIRTKWCAVQYIDTSTYAIQTLAFPVYESDMYGSDPSISGIYVGSSSQLGVGLSLDEIYAGDLGTKLGIDPNNIINVQITPFCPFPDLVQLVDTTIDAVWAPTSSGISYVQTSKKPSYYQHDNYFSYFKLEVNSQTASLSSSGQYTQQLPSGYRADTIYNTIAVCDYNGNPVWMLPYGMTASAQINIGFSIAPDSNHVYLFFGTLSYGLQDSASEGMCQSISLQAPPIASNTWQSYNVTMQRQYDIESAKASIEAAASKTRQEAGITAAESAVNGMMGGAVTGAIGGPIGALGGAIAGVIGGAAVGYAGSLAKADIEQSVDEKLRERTQSLTDAVMANQSQSLILSGTSPMWYYGLGSEQDIHIVILTEYDSNRTSSQYAEYGYLVDKPYSAITTVFQIGSTGPWQIEDLEISGSDVPTQARQYIKQLFAAGVYIDN